MNDYQLIEELAPFDKRQRWDALKTLGDQAAAHARRVLPLALEQHAHVYLSPMYRPCEKPASRTQASRCFSRPPSSTAHTYLPTCALRANQFSKYLEPLTCTHSYCSGYSPPRRLSTRPGEAALRQLSLLHLLLRDVIECQGKHIPSGEPLQIHLLF